MSIDALNENEDVEFKSNDYHQHYSFKMIKEANLESFFILMNTKNNRLLHNSYLNKQLEKTDFLFPNIPKAFFIKLNEPERNQLINLIQIPEEFNHSTNQFNSLESSTNHQYKNEQLETHQTNKSKNKVKSGILTKKEIDEENVPVDSSFEMFKLKFNNRDLTETEIENMYLELLDFEDVIGQQVQIKRKPESSLGRVYLVEN